MDAMTEITKRLYIKMPGAPMPEEWSDVVGNEHWKFCEQLANEIINAAQAYGR